MFGNFSLSLDQTRENGWTSAEGWRFFLQRVAPCAGVVWRVPVRSFGGVLTRQRAVSGGGALATELPEMKDS